jgi:hypothetical protein
VVLQCCHNSKEVRVSQYEYLVDFSFDIPIGGYVGFGAVDLGEWIVLDVGDAADPIYKTIDPFLFFKSKSNIRFINIFLCTSDMMLSNFH